jgi:hypothetical protein
VPELVECPADGCDYEGLRDSVLGHYSGKPDDAHRGGYARARSLLADESTDSTDTDNETPDSESNPVMGSADPNPSPSGDDREELPCGHESYDPTEAPDPPYRVGCDECGDTWEVVSE